MRSRNSRLGAVAVAVAAVASMLVVLAPAAGQAQEQGHVQDMTVVQQAGFATVAWAPVAGATEYEIERTPVSTENEATGPSVVVGVWRPNRQVAPESPTFADSGFVPGDRFQWRVRAVLDTGEPGPFSDPVFATTLPLAGPAEFWTEFEASQGAQLTSYDSEIAWTAAIADASERVRVETIGHTAHGREINLFIIGYPTPPATAAGISASPTAGSNCNVHGNEPSGREACFMMIRELAFSDDPWVIGILSTATVLIVPSVNGDGRAANQRGNSTGQDLNRDYGRLSQPETQAFVRFWRDYTPEVMNDGHEFGRTGTCDLPLMNTPQLNNAQATYDEAKLGLIEGWMYDQGAADGWWPCPYPVRFSPGGQSFGNTAGLKHVIGMLTEARSSGGPTRPNSGGSNSSTQRLRKAFSHLWTIRELLDYHRENLPAVQQAIADSVEFQTSNTGPVVFDGTYDWPAFPPPHPGEDPPAPNRPGPDDMLAEPPCGYLLTDEQYTTPLADGGSLPQELWTSPEQRLAFHGIDVEDRPAGHVVRMAQRLRGLIPLILDGQAEQVGIPIIVAAQRLTECPHAEVAPSSLSVSAAEDTQATVKLTVSNVAPEPEEELSWAVTTARADCSSPADLGWVSVEPGAGTTAASSTTTIDVTVDATGRTAPEVERGVLCVASNDPGEPVIAVPIELQVSYPFTGFAAPVANPPAQNLVTASQVVPMRFSLEGDRGLDVLDGGAPATQPVSCTTQEPTGPTEPAQHAGGLRYDESTDHYTYTWKTSRDWAGSCRQFILSLDDGSRHLAYFRFR